MNYQEAKEELLSYFEAYNDLPFVDRASTLSYPAAALAVFLHNFTLPASFYNIVTK